MDEHRSVDVKGRRIVPNQFTFHLSAKDHAGLADIDEALVTELIEAAASTPATRTTTSWGRCGGAARRQRAEDPVASTSPRMKESGGGVGAGIPGDVVG
jgi:hypothetical protein